MTRPDVVIIGAGHNGLVCASYLARAGFKTLVVEANEAAGGMAAPRTLDGGYHFPGLANVTYTVSNSIRKDLKLERFGYAPGHGIDTVALDSGGNHLTIGAQSVSGDGLPDMSI